MPVAVRFAVAHYMPAIVTSMLARAPSVTAHASATALFMGASLLGGVRGIRSASFKNPCIWMMVSTNIMLALCVYFNASSYIPLLSRVPYLTTPTLAVLSTSILWSIGLAYAKQTVEVGKFKPVGSKWEGFVGGVIDSTFFGGLSLISGATGGVLPSVLFTENVLSDACARLCKSACQ